MEVFPGSIAHGLAGLEKEAADPEWHSHLYLFIDLDRGRVVGSGGYKGPPRGGTVEIGYAVAPAPRGRELPPPLFAQLVEHARQRRVTLCVAYTLAEPNASTAGLERCGSSWSAEATNREDGPV